MQVNYCEDHDVVAIDSIENAVRELASNRSPDIAMNHLIEQGVLLDPIQYAFHFSDKAAPESWES
jgi:hypothetical protein